MRTEIRTRPLFWPYLVPLVIVVLVLLAMYLGGTIVLRGRFNDLHEQRREAVKILTAPPRIVRPSPELPPPAAEPVPPPNP